MAVQGAMPLAAPWVIGQRVQLTVRHDAPMKFVITDYNPDTCVSQLWDEVDWNIHYYNLDKKKKALKVRYLGRPRCKLLDEVRQFVRNSQKTALLNWQPPEWAKTPGNFVFATCHVPDSTTYNAKIIGYDKVSRRTHISFGDGSEWCWATKDKLRLYYGDQSLIDEHIRNAPISHYVPPFDPRIYGLPKRFGGFGGRKDRSQVSKKKKKKKRTEESHVRRDLRGLRDERRKNMNTGKEEREEKRKRVTHTNTRTHTTTVTSATSVTDIRKAVRRPPAPPTTKPKPPSNPCRPRTHVTSVTKLKTRKKKRPIAEMQPEDTGPAPKKCKTKTVMVTLPMLEDEKTPSPPQTTFPDKADIGGKTWYRHYDWTQGRYYYGTVEQEKSWNPWYDSGVTPPPGVETRWTKFTRPRLGESQYVYHHWRSGAYQHTPPTGYASPMDGRDSHVNILHFPTPVTVSYEVEDYDLEANRVSVRKSENETDFGFGATNVHVNSLAKKS